MEPIFTLPYSEFVVAKELLKHFKKKEGYSISVPISRQQKGFDILLYNQKIKKSLAIQVKSSRTYEGTIPTRKLKRERFKYSMWFNTFQLEKGLADFYVFFGLYPVYQQTKNIKSKSGFFKSLILCFSEKEMIELSEKVRTKREKKADKFFSFGFNTSNEIFGTRGFEKSINVSNFLLENKLKELK